MASLFKQKNYYYLQFYSASRKPAKKRVSLRTRTKSTALKLQRKLEDQFVTGEFAPWLNEWGSEEKPKITKDSTIQDVMEYFIEIKRKKDWRAGTARNTEYVLNNFIQTLDQNFPIAQITESHFNDFLNQSTIKYETKRSYKKTLKTFLIWLNDFGVVTLNKKKLIVNNESHEQEEIINYFTPNDIKTLTSYISGKVAEDLEKGFQKKNSNALWLVDFIHWQRLSGMRLSETLNLRKGDINTETWEIMIGNEHFVTSILLRQHAFDISIHATFGFIMSHQNLTVHSDISFETYTFLIVF